MNHLVFKALSGGPAGARSRDLRIKRPHGQTAESAYFPDAPCTLVGCTHPTVNQVSEKHPVRRPLLASLADYEMDHGHHHGGAE